MMSIQRRERGATLIISLIFLLIFLVMALSIFRGALTSSQAIGNMQWRNEAISAANEAIDRYLSNSNIAAQAQIVTATVNGPDGPGGLGGDPYDVNADGTTDVIVDFPLVTIDAVTRAGPRCLRIRPIPPAELSPTRPQDAGCFASSSAGGIAIEGGGGGATPSTGSTSLCADSEWSMMVRAADPSTSTSVEVVQGFSMRVPTVAVPVCD
jgi:type II secretory pathway pseudopilin PulG